MKSKGQKMGTLDIKMTNYTRKCALTRIFLSCIFSSTLPPYIPYSHNLTPLFFSFCSMAQSPSKRSSIHHHLEQFLPSFPTQLKCLYLTVRLPLILRTRYFVGSGNSGLRAPDNLSSSPNSSKMYRLICWR